MNVLAKRLWPLALSAVLAASGCGGPGAAVDTTAEAGGDSLELPRWVRIVPVESGGRSWYVGAVSMATSEKAALDQAYLDALSQISRDARERFAALITEANARSGVALKPIERFQLSDVGRQSYATAVEGAAVLEDTHVVPCVEGGGTICQGYVLVAVPSEVWVRELDETLHELRAEEVGDANKQMLEYLDWMIRHQERNDS